MAERIQKILNTVNYFICMLFFGIVTWQIFKYATTLWETGEVTETLEIAYYPFTYAVALGCLVMALTFFIDFLKLILGVQGKSQ